jgi:hypothetical protein
LCLDVGIRFLHSCSKNFVVLTNKKKNVKKIKVIRKVFFFLSRKKALIFLLKNIEYNIVLIIVKVLFEIVIIL